MDADLIAMQKICAESNFEVLSFSVDSLTADETLTCGIPADKIPCGKRNAAKKFLATYVSAKNTKPSSTVTNPTTTEGEEYDGLWRHVSEGYQVASNKREYLVRVLRKGYATAISWTEARLVEGKDLQSSENYRTIRWLNCDAGKVNAMAASLNAVTFVDPVVKGEKLTGTWYNIIVQPSIADDGSGIVTLLIANPQFTLTSYQNYLTSRSSDVTYLFQVPKYLAQDLITAHKITAGASASCSYANASGLVDIVLYSKAYNASTKTDVVTAWDCAHKEFTTTYYDLTEAEADDLVLTEPPVGWKYSLKKNDKGDGSWEVSIIKQQTTARSYDTVIVQEEAGSTTEQIEQIGVLTEDVEEVSEEDGYIVSQTRQHTDDCSVNAMTKKELGKEQISYIRSASPSGTSITTIKTVQTEAPDEPISEKGHIKKTEEKASKYHGRYDTVEEDSTPSDQVSTSYDASMAAEATKVVHTENETPLVAPVAAKGTIVRQSSQPTEAGNDRTIEETITPKKQTVISGEDSLAQHVVRTVTKENDSYSSGAPSAALGTIKRVTASPTESGNDDTIEEIITPKSRTVTEGTADAFKTALVTTKTQETACEAVPSPAVGLIKRVRNIPTETGFRTEKEDVTAVARDETSRTSAIADDYTEVTEKHHNAASIPEASTVSNGAMFIDGQMNEFQKYDYIKKTKTAKIPSSCSSTVTWEVKGDVTWDYITTYYASDVAEKNWLSLIRQIQKTYTHALSYHLTASAAAAAITGGSHGSHISHVKDNLWQAQKVTYVIDVLSEIILAAPKFQETEGKRIPPKA